MGYLIEGTEEIQFLKPAVVFSYILSPLSLLPLMLGASLVNLFSFGLLTLIFIIGIDAHIISRFLFYMMSSGC